MRRAVLVAALSAAVPLAARAQAGDGPGHTLGRPDAPVTVVEYVDFGCSACAEFAREAWPTLRRDYVDAGRVRWIVVPIDFGFRHGEEAARTAECAAEQQHFWPVHDALFEHRERWVGADDPRPPLRTLAVQAGVDEGLLRACLDADRADARIDAGTAAARDAGIRGTPTFFVNGRLVQGALPLGTFRTLLAVAGSG